MLGDKKFYYGRLLVKKDLPNNPLDGLNANGFLISLIPSTLPDYYYVSCNTLDEEKPVDTFLFVEDVNTHKYYSAQSGNIVPQVFTSDHSIYGISKHFSDHDRVKPLDIKKIEDLEKIKGFLCDDISEVIIATILRTLDFYAIFLESIESGYSIKEDDHKRSLLKIIDSKLTKKIK